MVAFPVLECIDCVSDVGGVDQASQDVVVEVGEDVFAALAHGFLGCLQVGYSLMGSTGSASITVTITVFCGAVDGIDDGISVRLHNRSLVLDGWFRHPLFSYKAKDPNILCYARTPGELINEL
ncbi:hypothetical protein CIP107580_00914 [Corynebacterium diphtheriae]|nr:hypothetical protein CIP107533_00939 [Corynebacterium diphtheriae]CAB0642846.1 hypothetical protein CIP107580_00914 [Corynebacterium diphtheriae]